MTHGRDHKMLFLKRAEVLHAACPLNEGGGGLKGELPSECPLSSVTAVADS